MIGAAWSASDTYLSLTVLVLLVLSGFFALAETSLVRMNKSRARSLQEQHRRGARALALLTETPQKFLNPLLLLVLICQLVSATMVGVLTDRLFGAAGLFIGIVGEVVVIFVFFEAIPKNYAVQHPDNAALITAPVVSTLLKFWPIKWLSWLLLGVAQGVIRLLGLEGQTQKMTESEVLAMADVAQEDKAIESSERNFIHSVIEFGDTIVREVMVPRIDMVDIGDTATVREALDLAVATGRSRIPVLGEGVDDVVGIVNLRHLAGLYADGRGSALVRDHMGEPRFVPETKRVASLLSEVRKGKSHLFIVIDEYGGTAGLVTLEDVLEELVGEITDESLTSKLSDSLCRVITAHHPADVVLHVRPQHLDGLRLTLVRWCVDEFPAELIESLLEESAIGVGMLLQPGLHPAAHLLRRRRVVAPILK